MHMKYAGLLSQNRNLANLNYTAEKMKKPQPLFDCLNHPQKPATHSLIPPETHEELYYCQKCSIMLASQGFNVIKLHRAASVLRREPSITQTLKIERQKDVQNFLREIQVQVEEIQNRSMEAQRALRTSQQNYGRVMGQIKTYFGQIQSIIEIQKYSIYNRVLSIRATAEGELRSMRKTLSLQLEELFGIEADIDSNMEAVESVEGNIYQTIMKNYRDKLSASYHIQSWDSRLAVSPVISLTEIPKDLFTLADRIHIKPEFAKVVPLHLRRDVSVKQNGRLSLLSNQVDESLKERKRFSIMIDPQSAKHIKSRMNDYSFEHDSGLYPRQNAKDMHKEWCNELIGQNNLLPQSILFQQSFSMTERREKEEKQLHRFPYLQKVISEQMQTSPQSIEYLGVTTHRCSEIGDSCEETTETLLIC